MTEPPDQKETPQEHTLGNLSEEELEDALSTLEHILRHRHVVSDVDPDEPAHHDENLPLLKNVVIPGDPPTPLDMDYEAGAGAAAHDEGFHESLDPAPPHDDLVVRLVNELDIIIESCVDDALAAAKQELMVRMKNHLDIVLPEILDELERRRYEADDEDEAPAGD